MDKYSSIFIFPGAVGYLFATALRRTGRKVLTISHPSTKRAPIPDILGAAVHLPDVFIADMASFGLPEAVLSPQETLKLHIAGKQVLIEPDEASQVLAMARAMPELDRKLMVILNRLEARSKRILPRISALYRTMPGKIALGKKLMRKSILFPFGLDPFRGLPIDGDGETARWALRLPAYITLGLQGDGGRYKALAAGYGLRSPHMSNINSAKLSIEAEHLYLGEGGDAIEADEGKSIRVEFTGGLKGVVRIDGVRVAFDKAFLSKDNAGFSLGGRSELFTRLQGLTLLSHSFIWKPPKGYDPSGQAHGVVVTDTKRPPVNDNFILYSIGPAEDDRYKITTAVTVERGETLTEHFNQKRRGYLIARMIGNFITAMGGELDQLPSLDPLPIPSLSMSGRGGFRLYEGNITPGNTVEDMVRYARWLSVRAEFSP